MVLLVAQRGEGGARLALTKALTQPNGRPQWRRRAEATRRPTRWTGRCATRWHSKPLGLYAPLWDPPCDVGLAALSATAPFWGIVMHTCVLLAVATLA